MALEHAPTCQKIAYEACSAPPCIAGVDPLEREEHTLVCPGFLVSCPAKDCRAVFKRADLEGHMNSNHRVSSSRALQTHRKTSGLHTLHTGCTHCAAAAHLARAGGRILLHLSRAGPPDLAPAVGGIPPHPHCEDKLVYGKWPRGRGPYPLRDQVATIR